MSTQVPSIPAMALTQDSKFTYQHGEVTTSFEKDGTPYTEIKARFEDGSGHVPTFIVEGLHGALLQVDGLKIEVTRGIDKGEHFEQLFVTVTGRACNAKGKADARKQRNSDHFHYFSEESARQILAAVDFTTVPAVLADAFVTADFTGSFLNVEPIVAWLGRSAF